MPQDDPGHSTYESLRRGANDGVRGAAGIIIKWLIVAVVILVVLFFSWNYLTSFFEGWSFVPDWFGWPDWLTWGSDESLPAEVTVDTPAPVTETISTAEVPPDTFKCEGWWSPFDAVCIGDFKWGQD